MSIKKNIEQHSVTELQSQLGEEDLNQFNHLQNQLNIQSAPIRINHNVQYLFFIERLHPIVKPLQSTCDQGVGPIKYYQKSFGTIVHCAIDEYLINLIFI